MKILFIGDVVGRVGRETVAALLPRLKSAHDIDLTIANCENAAGGLGITERTARELLVAGVDVLTGGDHIWDKQEAAELLDRERRIVRPANHPPGTPGRGSLIVSPPGAASTAVLNLQGRTFMKPLDCPFRIGAQAVDQLLETTRVVIVDFHAEATSEKAALTWYLAGRATAVLGTHTHVQTSDERIVRGHTAAITDVGMTGPTESVIGMRTEVALHRFVAGRPARYKVGEAPGVLSAVVLDVDEKTGAARSIERLVESRAEVTLGDEDTRG